MAAHSSVLAWEIPWTEEPGGLQSMGSQKSWTQLSARTRTHTHTHTHTLSLIIPLGTQSPCDGEDKNVGTTLAFDFLYLDKYV